jgi:hypothetical protein
MKIKYKVVRDGLYGDTQSVVAGLKAKVKYKVGEWVQAPKWLFDAGYHLCVFDKLEDAKEFKDGFVYCSIYKCEVEGEIKNLPEKLSTVSLLCGELNPAITPIWAPGTEMYKMVKLKDKVWLY